MASSNADDFFETLIHQNGSKIFLISLSTVCAIIWASGSYGVYWFVNHSSKAKPTLINRLIAKACLAGCQFYVFVQVMNKSQKTNHIHITITRNRVWLKSLLGSRPHSWGCKGWRGGKAKLYVPNFSYLRVAPDCWKILRCIYSGRLKAGNPNQIKCHILMVSILVYVKFWPSFQVPEYVRFLFGPLPENFCYLKLVLRSSYFVEILLLFNASSVAKYIYIFWLKNPLAFPDSFWCSFTTIAIKLFSLGSQFVWHALTPRQPINYFVCTGIDPTKFADRPFQVYGFFELLTVFIQVFVQARIKLYERKAFGPVSINSSKMLDMERFSLTSFFLNLFNISSLATTTFFMVFVSSMEPRKLVTYPNSLIVQFVLLCLPCLIGALMATTFYIKHKPLRNAVWTRFFRRSILETTTWSIIYWQEMY